MRLLRRLLPPGTKGPRAIVLALVTRIVALGHPTNPSGNNRSMR